MTAPASAPSLLAGLIYHEAGERMTPTHANKKGRRYRYYVSHNLIKPGPSNQANTGRRIPAGEVEELVERRITAFFADISAIHEASRSSTEEAIIRQRITQDAQRLSEAWRELPSDRKRAALCRLIWRITVRRETIDIAVRPSAIAVIVDPDFGPTDSDCPGDDAATIILSIQARLKRVGMELKWLVDGAGGRPRREVDRGLLRLLALSHRYREMLLAAHGKTITVLAREAGVGSSYFSRVVRLSFLAPEIAQMILRGRQPLDLNAKRLSLDTKLPNGLGGSEGAAWRELNVNIHQLNDALRHHAKGACFPARDMLLFHRYLAHHRMSSKRL